MYIKWHGTPQELRETAEKLWKARHTLEGYVTETVINSRPGWVDGEHIHVICRTIQEFLEREDGPRGLIVTTPPRHMKSTICSEALPAWYISGDPARREVMIASYNQTQARKMSRACRLMFDQPFHRRVFPGQTFLVDGADEFELGGKLNGRPSLIASGVGAGLTGSGADLIIVDDPVKDMAEAESSVIRDKVYDWFTSVALTRLSPKGKVLIVMTRWHHDDLAGRIISNDTRGAWQVLHLPAISDDGKALWPERYPVPALEKLRADIGSSVFTALYQGNPTPKEGGEFKRHWFQFIDRPLDGPYVQRCRYWDMAGTKKREGDSGHDPDWTVGALIARDTESGAMAVEDIVRLRDTPDVVRRTILSVAQQDGPDVRIGMEQEGGSAGIYVVEEYGKYLAGYDFRHRKPVANKSVRAMPMESAYERGQLKIMRGPWNRDYIDELCEFPVGKHDDQVDATSGAYNELVNEMGATDNVYFIDF